MITSVPGFRAGGLASGIKESGDPDLSMVATVDGAPVTAAGVFTTNLVAAAPVQISRRAPRRRPCRRGDPQLRQRQRRHGRAGSGRRAAHVRAHRAGPRLRDRRRARVPDRAHRHPDAHGPDRVGGAEARRAAHRRRGRRRGRGRGPADHRHRARRPRSRRWHSSDGTTATVGGMAKGAAMLAPVDGHDARGAHHRRRHRAADAHRARCRPRSTQQLQRAGGRRVPEHQRHRARARQRRRRQRRDHRDRGLRVRARSSRRSPPRAPTSRTRWRPTPRARPSSSRSRARRPQRPRGAARGAARWRRASSCSARSTARTPTGAGSSPSSA